MNTVITITKREIEVKIDNLKNQISYILTILPSMGSSASDRAESQLEHLENEISRYEGLLKVAPN
jgi:hypothetical protein